MTKRGPIPYAGCSVDGCEETKHYAKKYCKTHYNRNRRHGAPILYTDIEWNTCECGKPTVSRQSATCKACYQRWWYANRAGQSATNSRYKDDVKYNAAHGRVRALRGHPQDHECVLCLEPAEEWALSVDAIDVRYGASGTGRTPITAYSLDPYSYLAMCKKCHRAYDAEARGHTYKKTTA